MADNSDAAQNNRPRDPPRVSTGSDGLDDILGGGFDANRMYLNEGRPGTGKTTMALQFLLKGVQAGENVLYISLSETKRELNVVAERHGWSLRDVNIFELVPAEMTLDPQHELTEIHPAEMELSETTGTIFKENKQKKPTQNKHNNHTKQHQQTQKPLRY